MELSMISKYIHIMPRFRRCLATKMTRKIPRIYPRIYYTCVIHTPNFKEMMLLSYVYDTRYHFFGYCVLLKKHETTQQVGERILQHM